MQKHAYNDHKEYLTVYDPLPIGPEIPLYYDENTIDLPFYEDFPRLHYHNRYEIGICEYGEGLFLSDGKYYSVNKDSLIFVPPMSRHYSRSIHSDIPCKCRFIFIQKEVIDTILKSVGIKTCKEYEQNIPTVISYNDYPNAAMLLSQIIEITQNNIENKLASIYLILSAFLVNSDFVSEGAFKKNVSDFSESSKQSVHDKVAEYLYLHYQGSETAKELAHMFHISESQLRRKFLSAYGMPPIAYRNYLRCKIATKLLHSTELSIVDISEKIGYTSTSDFYRMFKKHYGISPSEYRKENL